MVAGLAEDVTDQHVAQEESARLAALTRENPSPVLQCDPEGKPLHVNPAAEQVCLELGLHDIYELLPPDHDQLIRAALEYASSPDVDVPDADARKLGLPGAR